MRELIERPKPGCDVEVDGGVDETTAPRVVGAGATVLVAGSAIVGDRDGTATAEAPAYGPESDEDETDSAEQSARQRSQVCNSE